MSTSQNNLSIPIIKIPEGRLGIWILIAGELVIFGGAIACYLLFRIRYPHWADMAKHTNTFIGALNTVVLLLSSYTVVRAHGASLKHDIAKVRLWLSCSVLGGLIFLINKGFEWSKDISEGFTLTSPKLVAAGDQVGSLFWSFYYFMTGLHGTHVLVGMICMIIIMIQTRKGNNLHRVELVGMYWHMVDLIWIFLFPLLYIAK